MGIVRELAGSALIVLADNGYHGAGDHIRTPYKGRNKPASQKAANRAHAKLRGPGERANAQLAAGDDAPPPGAFAARDSPAQTRGPGWCRRPRPG
jgi:DDE superfamily endonuclease